MPQGATLQIVGYREFMRGLAGCDRATKRSVRAVLRRAGDAVKADASGRFAPVDARSAAGYRTVVRQRGIAVEQSIRRTTGQHPEYGALQMRRALIPALDDNEERTYQAIERAMDDIALTFNYGGTPVGEGAAV